MTERKFTDEDLIKALDHCRNGERGSKCSKCEYVTGCKTYLIGLALDLINRQRAEIEAWETGQKALQKNLSQIIRAEAIKEFAEMLKEELRLSTGNNGGFVPSIIDNLVKEMTESKNDEHKDKIELQ